MDASFLVNGYPICTGVNKRRDELVRILDHQVHIQRHRDCFFQRADHRRADGDVRHKMAIHHINVQELRPALDGRARVIAQTGEICR